MLVIFGVDIQTIYLYTLGISAVLAILYLLFSDLLDGILDVSFNPTVIFIFFTFLGASGYLLEHFRIMDHLLIFFISFIISILFSLLLQLYVFTPLKKAETSLAYSQNSLEGKIAKVIIPIPADGYGEVVISNTSGTISKSAISIDQTEIKEGQEVIVIYVKNGLLVVSSYDS